MTTKAALHHRLAPMLLVLALVAVACGGRGSPASFGPGPGGATPPPAADPTPVPGATGDPGSGPGGGSSGGGTDPGTGGDGSEPGSPGAGGGSGPVAPGAGGGPGNQAPTMVTPVAGANGIHEVRATDLQVSVSGRDVTARVAWWSGVEPCNVLAGVQVTPDARTITLTVSEGSVGGPDAICVEIALFKATIVGLGSLEPGTWTIRATGEAAPVDVTIAG